MRLACCKLSMPPFNPFIQILRHRRCICFTRNELGMPSSNFFIPVLNFSIYLLNVRFTLLFAQLSNFCAHHSSFSLTGAEISTIICSLKNRSILPSCTTWRLRFLPMPSMSWQTRTLTLFHLQRKSPQDDLVSTHPRASRNDSWKIPLSVPTTARS